MALGYLPLDTDEMIFRLNHYVLKMYLPNLEHITLRACIATVYIFADNSQWDQTTIKGPLFIARLHPLPGSEVMRYVAIILNRQHMINWVCFISHNISIVDNGEIIVLSNPAPVPDAVNCVDSHSGIAFGHGPAQCFGLWVYAEEGTTVADQRSKTLTELEHAKLFAEGMEMAMVRREEERQAGNVPVREPFDESKEFLRWMEGELDDDPNCPY